MADLEQLNDWELLLSSDSEIDSSSAPFNPDSDSSSDSLADSTTAEAADFQGKHEEVLQEEEIRGNQEIGVQNQNLLDSGLGVEAEIEDAGVMERVHSSQGGGGGEGMVWWKVPFHIFKFCLLRVNPVWSLSVAAAVLGFVILRKRLNRMKPKTRNIPIKLAVEDKKASQLRMHATRLNEAFTVVRSVPIVRARLLTAGVTPWPTLNLR